MKTKFRVFTALLLALMVLVSVLPLQAAAEIGQSGTATRAEAENTAEAALSVKPMLTPSYTPSASYRSGKYYTQLCNVSLTGNQRTDLVNVARSQLGYHEGDSIEDLNGTGSGSGNYSEYGYWFGTQVKGNTYGHYYAWCAMFVSWCARQAGIPTSVISNAAYAHADGSNSSGGYSYFHVDYKSPTEYTPQEGDLIFFDKASQAGEWDHVGIVIGVSNGQVYTIEGNASNAVISGSYPLTDAEIQCYGLPKYVNGEPDGGTLSNTEVINQKIDYLDSKISYFTTTGAACGTYESNHMCDKCLNTYVVASSWFRNIFGSVSVNNFPEVYDSNGSCYRAGYSCYGFANFAEWYIFKSSNSSSVNVNKIGSYSFNYSNMSRYAQPGDLISFDTHYAIFISADSSNGIYVLDSNWAWSSYGQCRVSKHYIPYSNYNTATINRSTNAPSISPDPTTPPDVENGNWQYRVTGSAGLNVRSGPSTDYPVLTAIPKGTIVTVTQRTSTNWGKMTYNGTTGWGCLDYCELVTSNPTPTPTPTPTPAPSGGVQDLTNPKNPNKYSTPPSSTYLNVGDSGNYVRWLQACLNQCGYSCDVDGQFGYGTAEALKSFQRKYGLTVDGGFGPECRTKILEVLTVAAPTITTAYDANGTRVTISGSSGTTIFYTTNGSTPTESSNKYNGSFVLNGAATVKAVAMRNCRYNSHVSSYGITVTKHTVTFKDWNGTVLKTQSVYHTGAATAPANPTRTGYTFTGWDKAFTNVTADLVVTAQYSANTYTVTFKDWNGTVLKTQQVQYGGAATAPANPTRAGYTFTGWDKAFTNVTANLVVTAQYSINSYTVTFKDWNGTVLKTQQVQYGGAATAPANPTRAGYTFTGWDKAFTNVTANLVVTAQYSINTYTVTFKDWNGMVLKTQQVQYGGAATAPANPTRTGYTFTGWDKAFINVTANLVVTAQYSINTYTVTFKDWNGTVLKTQQVQYGGAATAPANPTRAGYTFTGWDKAFTNVTANLVVTAQYVQNEPVSTPVPSDAPQIVVESKTTSAGSTVAVNISIANNPGFVTMGIQVAYDSNLTLLSVSDTGLVPGQMFSTEIENPQPLYWANPTATADCTVNGKIATLTFKVADNAEEGEYHIRVSYDYDNYDIYNQSGEAVQFATVNGTLTVTDVVYGDVNGDGRVNNLDGMVLMRHLAKWPSYPASMISPGADVNADGRINNLDGMILMRHLAKWPAYATLPYSSQKGIVAVRPDNTTFENEPTIVVGNAEAAPGETVRIPIELANNPGVVVMGIMVGYDENLTLLGFEDTGLLPGQLHSTVIENPQPLFWGNTTSGNCTENGVIIYLEFKVADDAAPGTYSITVTYDYENYDIYNYDGEPIEFAIQNGAVTVAAAQPEMHTVTFKDWDGTVLKTQEVQHGGDAEAPADPTRVGYTFTGWDKAFTNITADLVVTAQYEINTYTVTFKDWNGTVLKTQQVQYGGAATAPANPTRAGYTFTGWDKAFTNVTADLVVTAQYSINTYTVTFKDWNGTVLKTQQVQYGGAATAPANPTRTGYTFTGWDKAFTNVTTNLVVTAQYSINTYTVTFKDWDGTVLKTQEVQYGGDAEAPADPTRVGYTFTGWDKAFTNIMADLVVTAQYEINTYTVTFKDWNGTVLKTQEVQYGGDAEAPADPTRVGYTFTGWDEAFTNITADLVVTAQYEINTYTVTFKDWDGTVLKTQEVQYGGDAEAPADPTRTGYTFTGWDKAFTNVTADLVVTAQYEINTYTVTFKDWDGTVLKTQEVQYGGDAEAPADPTRTGYTFTGWDKEFTNITADLVVTAQYEMLGDVDGDGNVSMADALTILRMAMDILPVENQQIADVDGDGFITSMDALLALRFAMHIEQ